MEYKQALKEAIEALKKSDIDLEDEGAVWKFIQPWVEKLGPTDDGIDIGEEFHGDVMQAVVY
jgi:hypothetical protein